MEFTVESTGALEAQARRAADGDQAVAVDWARWILDSNDVVELGTWRRWLAWRLLTRGPVVPLGPSLEAAMTAGFSAKASAAALVAHRWQCAALAVDAGGLPPRFAATPPPGFNSAETRALEALARADLGEILEDLDRLFPDAPLDPGPPIFFGDEIKPGFVNARISSGGAAEDVSFQPRFIRRPSFRRDDAALIRVATRVYGVKTLRLGQAEGVAALLEGRDLVMAMPTGGGKSLVYHLAALLSPGTALIVAPLRSLLRDQVRRLSRRGVGATGVLSGDDPAETRRGLRRLERGELIMLFAAPERLDSEIFRAALRGAAEADGIPFVAIDEAQCAARRSHDWRPAYRLIGTRLRAWCASPAGEPVLAAFSGGASAGVLAEAERALGLRSPATVRAGPPRTNLRFHVARTGAGGHRECLRDLLTRSIPGGRFGPGIVFCPRVEGEMGAADVAEDLAWSEGIDSGVYTGRAPRGHNADSWTRVKSATADSFLSGRRGLLCATRAFGMGVDRPDVRFTVHLGLPVSLEEFFQQAGRAGRDGAPAGCWIIVHAVESRRARRWATLSLEILRGELRSLARGERDDISRAYSFHARAFPGEEAELRDTEIALLAARIDSAGRGLMASPGDGSGLSRVVARLEEAGVIADVEGRTAGWAFRVADGWSGAFAMRTAAARIAREYRIVEPGRRSSLAELVELITSPRAGEELARRLISFS